MNKIVAVILIGLLAAGVFAVDKQRSISSGERIMKGAIVGPAGMPIDTVVTLFRGERAEIDSSGFYSFVKKADAEVFDIVPFKQKMMKALGEDSSRDDSLAQISPLLKSNIKEDKYYILITKNIEPITEGINDISGFRQKAGEPHLFFSFIAQNAESVSSEDILIKSTSIKKRNYVYAPDKTIIILMNPNRVKSISYWPFKLDSQFIQIPRLELLSEEEISEIKSAKPRIESPVESESESKPEIFMGGNLARQSLKSQLLGLDVAPFFEAQDSAVISKFIGRKQFVEVRL
jgi:hypothetical protein